MRANFVAKAPICIDESAKGSLTGNAVGPIID